MASTETPTAADFLRLALDRWRSADTFEKSQRDEGTLDLKFLNLEQWDAKDKQAREANGKHALVIDQIGEPYRQLVGQQRQAKPAIQVSPVDSGADIDTADVFQGLIRHIESTGHAKPARDEAFKGAVACGWGYYRILTEWEHDQTAPSAPPGPALFDQCLKYQAIENQFTVYRDPSTPLHEQWKQRFCVITEDIPKEEFKRRWPDAIATNTDAFASTGINMPDWFPETSVKVADYFYVEYEAQPEIALLNDGTVVPATEVPKGVEVVQKRTPLVRNVKLAKITGAEILEGNDDKTAGRDWPGSYIPVVMMHGESITLEGKRVLRGLPRAARDLMRAYNYQVSELVYELACSPKSKVLMPSGAQEGHETQWKESPSKAFPYLLYNPTVTSPDNGHILQTPEPKVAHFTDASKIQAIVVAINQLKADLRTVTGWYDPTDPSRRNTDQSGRAILARKEAQNEGAVNYKENFGDALLYDAMILLDLIPKLYYRPDRVLRLIGEEGEQLDPVTVGAPWQKPRSKVQGIFEWGAGRYDVAVSIGASYLTRRQEATDQGLELMKILDPPQRLVVAPSVVSNMDMPGSQQLAEKLKKTLPPELQDDAEQMPIPPQIQQQLKQMQMMIEAMTKELNAKNDLIEKDTLQIDSHERIKRADIDAKIQIAAMDNDIKLRIEEFKLNASVMQAELDAKQAQLTQMYAQSHERGMAGLTQQHEQE